MHRKHQLDITLREKSENPVEHRARIRFVHIGKHRNPHLSHRPFAPSSTIQFRVRRLHRLGNEILRYAIFCCLILGKPDQIFNIPFWPFNR